MRWFFYDVKKTKIIVRSKNETQWLYPPNHWWSMEKKKDAILDFSVFIVHNVQWLGWYNHYVSFFDRPFIFVFNIIKNHRMWSQKLLWSFLHVPHLYMTDACIAVHHEVIISEAFASTHNGFSWCLTRNEYSNKKMRHSGYTNLTNVQGGHSETPQGGSIRGLVLSIFSSIT